MRRSTTTLKKTAEDRIEDRALRKKMGQTEERRQKEEVRDAGNIYSRFGSQSKMEHAAGHTEWRHRRDGDAEGFAS